nr:hypothetical protein [Anabaena sp. YBS01]
MISLSILWRTAYKYTRDISTGLPASISGKASIISSVITGRRAKSRSVELFITCSTVSASARNPNTCRICSSSNFSNSSTSKRGVSRGKLIVEACNSALSKALPSFASGKCSVRQVRITFAPGTTTLASSQKLLIISWRFTLAAISSKPSKINSTLPMRLSCSKAE